MPFPFNVYSFINQVAMHQPILSISLIVKNEQDNLPKLFNSLHRLRKELEVQVVVTDTGSRDDTINICKENKCEIHHFSWTQNFADARNHSLSKCRGTWVLWLDADDVMSDKLSGWLTQNILGLDNTNVYTFEIISNLDDGSFNQFNQIRLFPNGKNLNFKGAIHESLSHSVINEGLKVFNVNLPVYHYGYENKSILEAKKKRNQNILEKLYEKGECHSSNIFALARTYQLDKNFSKALKLLREIISDTNNKSIQEDVWLAAHIYYGQILGFQNDFEEALQFFKKHFKKGESNPQYLFEFGKLLLVTDQLPEAKHHLEECLKYKNFSWTIPTDWKSIYKGAQYLLQQVDVSLTDREKLDIPSLYRHKLPGLAGLSVCTIVKNEEANIKELAKAIPIPNVDWQVVDTGSSDNTINILKKLGVTTHQFKWNDNFSDARNFSLRQSKKPYILWLDADDRPTDGFWEQLSDLLQTLPKTVNPEVPLNNQPDLKALRFIIQSPRDTGTRDLFSQIRLIPNHPHIYFEGSIHEQLASSLNRNNVSIEDRPLTINHIGYYNSKAREAKLQRNFSMLQKEYRENPMEPAVGLELGNCYFQMGRFLESIQLYLKILENHKLTKESSPPDSIIFKSIPLHIANAYERIGEMEKCEEWHLQALRWEPLCFFSHYWMAKKHIEKNGLDNALNHLSFIADNKADITIVASDNTTIKKNALGMLVLLLWGRENKNPDEIKKRLNQLLSFGVQSLPVDPGLPRDIYIHFEMWDELENYQMELTRVFPEDLKNWEDFFEILFTQQRYGEIIDIYSQHSHLQYKSGIIEAFIAKSLEETPSLSHLKDPYTAYINALFHFPSDPTLIYYFTEYLNHQKNFRQAFDDIELIPNLNGELLKLKGQLEQRIQKSGN